MSDNIRFHFLQLSRIFQPMAPKKSRAAKKCIVDDGGESVQGKQEKTVKIVIVLHFMVKHEQDVACSHST